MITQFLLRVVLVSLGLTLLTPVWSQSISILGNSNNARDCYFSAQLAIQLQSTSSSEIQACTDALNLDHLTMRDKAATFVNRGVLHVANEDFQAAVKDYTSAMKLYPDFGAIYVNRGNLFFLGQAYEQAVAEYNKALEKGVNQDFVAYLNRGMAFEKLGEYQKALSDYELAIELAPEWPLPKSKLERLKGKMNSSNT